MKEIEIPEGYEARIDGNKIIIELKESEDERIRKALIDFFQKKVEKGFEWVEYGIPNNAVLAYLEKQKEQKLIPKFKVGDTIRHKKYPTESYKITSMYKDIMYIFGETEETSIRIPVADQDLWELVEKPAEWSEEDEQFLLVCKNALNKYQHSDHWDANIISKWLENRLKDLKKL